MAGKGCIEYEWTDSQSGVKGSSPVRRLFEPTEEVSIRFYLKLSEGWGWSGRNYHPHLTHFLTTENSKWHGPAASHLTLYIEANSGKLRLGATDMQNRGTRHGLTQGPLRGGYNGKLYDSKWFLALATFSMPLPVIATQVGWITAEVGRQPWIVYRVPGMRTAEAVSSTVSAGEVHASLAMFGIIYAILGVIWVVLLRREISRGPTDVTTRGVEVPA